MEQALTQVQNAFSILFRSISAVVEKAENIHV